MLLELNEVVKVRGSHPPHHNFVILLIEFVVDVFPGSPSC